jgi:hypothetical protein
MTIAVVGLMVYTLWPGVYGGRLNVVEGRHVQQVIFFELGGGTGGGVVILYGFVISWVML